MFTEGHVFNQNNKIIILKGTPLSLPFSSYAQLTIEMIDALLSNIEKKSIMYQKQSKPILSNLFLLNNYHYISKFLKANTRVLEMCGKEIDDRVAVMSETKRVDYFDGWNSVCEVLMDSTHVENGVMKSLSKQQKDEVKEKFKVMLFLENEMTITFILKILVVQSRL